MERARLTLARFWWWVRGVAVPEDYRALCARCGRTGQVHIDPGDRCLRFRRQTPVRGYP